MVDSIEQGQTGLPPDNPPPNVWLQPLHRGVQCFTPLFVAPIRKWVGEPGLWTAEALAVQWSRCAWVSARGRFVGHAMSSSVAEHVSPRDSGGSGWGFGWGRGGLADPSRPHRVVSCLDEAMRRPWIAIRPEHNDEHNNKEARGTLQLRGEGPLKPVFSIPQPPKQRGGPKSIA